MISARVIYPANFQSLLTSDDLHLFYVQMNVHLSDQELLST